MGAKTLPKRPWRVIVPGTGVTEDEVEAPGVIHGSEYVVEVCAPGYEEDVQVEVCAPGDEVEVQGTGNEVEVCAPGYEVDVQGSGEDRVEGLGTGTTLAASTAAWTNHFAKHWFSLVG